jgi:hypothetical protein
MEEDEQININVLANDNFVIDRVEFLLNNATIFTATVSPYNARWEIDMRDVNSAAGGFAWTPFVSDDPDIQPGTAVTYGDGFQAIVTNGGVYLEGYLVKAIAYDAAGNKAESDEVRIYVRHEKPK